MRNLVAVVFVEPVTAGQVFARDAWPLHITLARFDVADPQAAADDDGGPGAAAPGPPADALAEDITRRMDPVVRAALGEVLTAGEPATFGRNGSIPVTLIEPNSRLQRLHEGLLDVIESLPARIATAAYTRSGYRPHVSHQGAKMLTPGDRLILDRVALVDMAPGGTHSSRKLLALWTATL